jgi:hypothetical protein
MKSDLVDIEMMVHAATDKAILVSDDGDKSSAVWLALSQIECDRSLVVGRRVVVTMPDWLATEKELV